MLGEEKKTNLNYNSQKDLDSLKKLLLKQVIDNEKLKELLKSRCFKLKEMISIYEVNIITKDQIILKQKNVNELNWLIHELTETLIKRSEDEISLGMKTRDLEYAQHETKIIQGHLNSLKRNFHILKKDVKGK